MYYYNNIYQIILHYYVIINFNSILYSIYRNINKMFICNFINYCVIELLLEKNY